MEKKSDPVFAQKIKLNSFGPRQYFLYIDEDKITSAGTTIKLKEISDLKHGVDMLQFQAYGLGRKYILHIKSSEKEIRLVFVSILGIYDAYFRHLYEQLLQLIWDRIADRIFAEKLQALKSEKGFDIGNCLVQKTGIRLQRQKLFSRENNVILWEELTYQVKYNRLSLYSKNQSWLWTDLYFTKHYNVDIFISILEWLYNENGLAELQN